MNFPSPRFAIPAIAVLSTALAEDNIATPVAPAAPPKALAFDLADVRLLEGPFKTGQDIAVKYLLSLEPDRFLANFRKEAGLQPKAAHYGGWEAQGVSGHCGGHYLSACALAFASTGNAEFKRRADYMVSELAACQEANKDGYVGAIPNGKKIYAEVAAGNIRSGGFDLNGCWVPNYTQHKVLAGLRDAWRHTGNRQALEVEKRLADWFAGTFRNLNGEQMQRVLACEHGGLNEVFADLYLDSGDKVYLDLSRKFHHREILDPLGRGEDILPGKHANTQIPKLIGLADRFEIAGDPADRKTADFFWERVVCHHSYVTGGHCDREHFGPPDKLNDRLSPLTTETCNVYNMLKLTRHVFGWKPTADVADFHERALLNHIRSTQHPDGRVIYNLSLQPGHHKEYQSPYDAFTCCVGTGFENHVRYGEGIYYHDAESLWVNLTIASELKWRAKGVTVRQGTAWPDADTSTITIGCERPTEFTLRLRRPNWALTGMFLRVNGEDAPAASAPSSYAEIRRAWRNGDRVEVRLPMSLRTESMPDNPRRVAVFYGPTLLAADLGPVDDPAASQPMYVPVLTAADRPVEAWVKPVDPSAGRFRTSDVGKPRDVELVPFHRLHDRRYTVYLDLLTNDEWAERESELRAAREAEQALAARTLDQLHIGEMQPERDHNLRGEHSSAGEAQGRKWRHATDGGWFEFSLKCDPAKPNELSLTYWGDETGDRNFDIIANGSRIGTQQLLHNQPGRFFDVIYPIPEKLTRDKSQITIRLQAHPGNWAGGLFGARMLKAAVK
ncbi:MAG: glycoside hydrolase family 127 protein [Verrucomicrobia bacterium]|nr:glycoside hydrolase family 127 protein [Verrucomicrobiota bacterium]